MVNTMNTLGGQWTVLVCSLLAVVVVSGTSAPVPTPETGHNEVEAVPNYFYSPAEFLQICAEFPSLAACQQGSLVEKRKSAYMRFGKRSAPEALEEEDPSQAMEKRKSAYMRFGKRSPEAPEELEQGMEKRKSAYMRFGKRKSAYMRFGKRSSDGEMEKRKSAYMRFGKRSPPPEEDAAPSMEKRKSAYMRFGKRSSDSEDNNMEMMEKRKSAYMRFGKRR